MLLYFLIILFTCFSSYTCWQGNMGDFLDNKIENQAVVIVPVADVISEPFFRVRLNKSINKTVEQLYKNLPFAPQPDKYACLRLHQLLFNEVVIVKRILNNEVECQAYNFFYYDDKNKARNTFWLQKKNIVYLKDLIKKKIDLNIIPPVYTKDNLKYYKTNKILTLIKPWYDTITKKYYSAGTRFMRIANKDTKNSYAVKFLDFNNFKQITAFIEKKYCLVDYPKTLESSLKLFINILKSWTNNKSIIPYVWGGCSYIKTYNKNIFYKKSDKIDNKTVYFWMRPKIIESPYSGCECSSLILRIAQIVGMPYFYKNTSTLSKCLKTLAKKEELKNGDLIWYEGHVLIVSDVKKNLATEAVGYQFGYGKVHELHISKIFAKIKNYKDLINAYHEHKPLQRLNIAGLTKRKIPKFKLFKIRSIWSKI